MEEPYGEYQRWLEYNAANNLPTQTHDHNDPATVAAVGDPEEKRMLINVAKAVVHVSFSIDVHDVEDLDGHCAGIIIGWDMDNKTARILTCGCFGHDIDDDSKAKIYILWPYKEDDGLIEAELLFFSTFYQLSLLEVAFQGTLLDIPTQIPLFGLSPPKQGDVVFALGRGKDLSLVARRGKIMQQQEHLSELRQGFLFVNYELPEDAIGGPAVNHHGNVVGLSTSCAEGVSVILPISTALSCVQMWTTFGQIARPFIGMRLRNMEVPDNLSGATRFGLVVDQVDPKSAAWNHGIRNGNVIVSFDEHSPKPLPEFEGFLLSHGSGYLQGTYTEASFKLEVQDAANVKRSIVLHVPFSDVANVSGSSKILCITPDILSCRSAVELGSVSRLNAVLRPDVLFLCTRPTEQVCPMVGVSRPL